MSRPVEFLDLDDLIELARLLLGDPPPIADIGLLGSAVARPQTTVFGTDAYPDLWTKAAALLQSVVGNHALIDGNKRLGWVATATFLEINDVDVTSAANDSVYRLVMAVATQHHEIEDLAVQLRSLVLPTERGMEEGRIETPRRSLHQQVTRARSQLSSEEVLDDDRG